MECQSHRLTVEDLVTMEYITRYIVNISLLIFDKSLSAPLLLNTFLRKNAHKLH